VAPQKTSAIILHILPYRETSCILDLLTEHCGIVKGIAKGIKRTGKNYVPIERGLHIETLVYLKAEGGLSTLGSISVNSFYSSIRVDLCKAAVRDALFELILKSLHPGEPHLELFTYVQNLLHAFDKEQEPNSYPLYFWRFCIDFAKHLGIGINTAHCQVCGKDPVTEGGGVLLYQNGAIGCQHCGHSLSEPTSLSTQVIRFMRDKTTIYPALAQLPSHEKQRLTKLFAAYCRYHVDFKTPLKSVTFLCGLV